MEGVARALRIPSLAVWVLAVLSGGCDTDPSGAYVGDLVVGGETSRAGHTAIGSRTLNGHTVKVDWMGEEGLFLMEVETGCNVTARWDEDSSSLHIASGETCVCDVEGQSVNMTLSGSAHVTDDALQLSMSGGGGDASSRGSCSWQFTGTRS